MYGVDVDTFDPYINSGSFLPNNGSEVLAELRQDDYDGIILAVAHQQFVSKGVSALRELSNKRTVFFDVMGAFDRSETDGSL